MPYSLNRVRIGQVTSKPTVASLPPAPGILLLSPSRMVIYVTHSAQTMLTALHDDEMPPNELPSAIHRLCDELQHAVCHCASPQEWTQIQIHRTAYTFKDSFSLRGFVIPDAHSSQGRMLLLLEVMTDPMEKVLLDLTTDCQLTARQQSVARGLVRGLTNKELANELHISAHTVKEYVRVVMTKVKATTRTGAVARLSGLIDRGEELPHNLSKAGRPVGSRQWV